MPHYRENSLRPVAIPLGDAFELRAPVHGHAEAIDDNVGDLVHAVTPDQAPIDPDWLSCAVTDDFAGDDRSIRIELSPEVDVVRSGPATRPPQDQGGAA